MKKQLFILLFTALSMNFIHSESLLSTGAPIADFSFKDLQSSAIQFSQMKSKLTVIHLWSAKDRKGIASLVIVEKIYRKYRNDDIAFISSSVDGYSDKVVNFLKKLPGFGYTLPVYIMGLIDATRIFRLTRLPQLFVVNEENKLIYSGAPDKFDPEKYLKNIQQTPTASIPVSGWITHPQQQTVIAGGTNSIPSVTNSIPSGTNIVPSGTNIIPSNGENTRSQLEQEALRRNFNPSGMLPTSTNPSNIFPEVQPDTYNPPPSSLPVAQPWETDSGRGNGQIGIPLNIPGPGTLQLRYPTEGHVASGFGYRRNPFNGRSDFHPGIDIFKVGNFGLPVYAAQNGVVMMAVAAGNFYGYGLFIEINHGSAFSTTYGHLSAVLVTNGQEVKKGQLIGRVGTTGASTGPHLHFELRYSGKHINPVPYFEPY